MPARKGQKSTSISVYNYTDYRRFLADFYKQEKKRSTAFSYRYFAGKAGISSVGLYKDVVDGRKALGRALLSKFAQALKLDRRETEYFEAMVFFCEARTVEEQKLYFERMLSLGKPQVNVLKAAQHEYYSRWYYSAIRALLSYEPFDGDYAALGRRLSPSIRPHQARKAIAILEKLDLIRKDEAGRYTLTDNLITSGRASDKNEQTMNIVSFQRAMMNIAGEAYDRHHLKDLDMSTLTLSISPRMLPIVKKKLAELRTELLALAEKEPAPSRVYQLNHQFFPLSQHAEGGEA
jgi:uncharacterized protein (TIGR02147 family)